MIGISSLLWVVVTMSLINRLQKAQKRQRSNTENLEEDMTRKGNSGKRQNSTKFRGKKQKAVVESTNHWKCVGASVQGTGHSPCQDFHCYGYLPTGELLVAVADGAGSAAKAEIGAQLACNAAIEALTLTLGREQLESDELWHSAIHLAFRSALEKLSSEAQAEGVSLKEFATTLIVMVCTNQLIVGGMIGDGTSVIRDIEGNISCLFVPQKGEYANEAWFLTTPNALNRIAIHCVHTPITAVALLTDGLIRLSCNTLLNQPHPGFFNPLFKFCAEMEGDLVARQELSGWLDSDVINKRVDDDKTLVLIAKTQCSKEESLQNEGIRSKRTDVRTGSGNRKRGTRTNSQGKG